jgi:hypothetical protein
VTISKLSVVVVSLVARSFSSSFSSIPTIHHLCSSVCRGDVITFWSLTSSLSLTAAAGRHASRR